MQDSSPLDEYAMLSVIGKGSYAKVILCRKKSNGDLYAIKSMKKKYIEKKNQTHRIMSERDILIQLDHPFLIKIKSSFQNEKKLFLVLDYCPGGQLFRLLSKKKRLSEAEIRFYAAQIIQALQYLHSKNIIYRDLKPENVLIGTDGYIKLTDFGLSKNNIVGDYDTFSVCGTPEYLAPEVINKKGHGRAVDWWCLGSIMYELIHGLPPFYSKNRNQLFDKIKHTDPYMNKNWSKNIRDLFARLFQKDPEERMKHVQTIKQHPWFDPISWEKLRSKEVKAPFVPVVKGQCDVSNFDKEFTQCDLSSYCESLGQHKELEGFSYERSVSPRNNQLEQKLQQMKIEEGQELQMMLQEETSI